MPKSDPEKWKKYGIYEGVAATIMSTIVTSFLSVYIISLGGSNIDVGLVLSIPALLAIISYLPAAYIAEKGISRKKIVIISASLSRTLWIPFAAIPFYFISGASSVPYMIIIASLYSLLGAFILPSWSSLMGDIIPAGERGKYFGARSRLCIMFSMLAVIICGLFIDSLGTSLGFFITFLIAGLAGFISSLFFMGFPDIRFPVQKKFDIKKEIRKIISERNFRNYIIAFSVFQFGVSLASPFFNIYLTENMGAPYIWISVLIIAGGLTKIIFQKGWGTFSDRFGHLHILLITSVGATFVPFLWIFAPSPEYTISIEIISGLSWAGLNLASFNYLLEISRGKKRTLCSALFWTFTGISIFLGPIAGGLIADAFINRTFFFMNNMEMVFFTSWIFRVFGAVFLIKALSPVVTDPAISTKYVTSEIIDAGVSYIERPFIMLKMTSYNATRGSVKFLLNQAKVLIKDIKKARTEHPKGLREEINRLSRDLRSVRGEHISRNRILEKRIFNILSKLKNIEKKRR